MCPSLGGDRDPRYTRETQSCRWKLLEFTEPPEVWIGLDANDERQIYYCIAEEEGELLLWRNASEPAARKYLELTRITE